VSVEEVETGCGKFLTIINTIFFLLLSPADNSRFEEKEAGMPI
jgi:hypothetical protein